LRELAYMAGGLQPKSFLAGMTALAQNDRATAEANFTEALPHFVQALRGAPEAAERHANLGLLYAFMGKRVEAIAEGRRAVELKPESRDAYDGAIMSCYLALIYARLGANDLA